MLWKCLKNLHSCFWEGKKNWRKVHWLFIKVIKKKRVHFGHLGMKKKFFFIKVGFHFAPLPSLQTRQISLPTPPSELWHLLQPRGLSSNCRISGSDGAGQAGERIQWCLGQIEHYGHMGTGLYVNDGFAEWVVKQKFWRTVLGTMGLCIWELVMQCLQELKFKFGSEPFPSN